MSNSAWCDLNEICTVLKLLDKGYTSKCNCQKQITFSLKQFQIEGNGFKYTMKRNIQRISNSLEKIFEACSQCSSTVYWYACKC